MAGDEITADWLGNLFGEYVTTSNNVQRFYGSSLRLRDVKIMNYDPAQAVCIGKYNSSVATFTGYSLVVMAHETIDFKYIDLYELGFRHFTGAPPFTLHVFGSNEY